MKGSAAKSSAGKDNRDFYSLGVNWKAKSAKITIRRVKIYFFNSCVFYSHVAIKNWQSNDFSPMTNLKVRRKNGY